MTPYLREIDTQITAYKELQHGHRLALDFESAAKEVLHVSAIARRPHDLKWCELMQRELIEDYHVDWSRIAKEFNHE